MDEELVNTVSNGEAHTSIACLEKVGLDRLKSHVLDVDALARPRSSAGSGAVIPDVFIDALPHSPSRPHSHDAAPTPTGIAGVGLVVR